MGIPHLTRHLLPFSETVTLSGEHGYPQQEGSPYVSSVVIDGPSLVYHVYFRLLSWATSARSVAIFDAQPTCHEVSIGVMMYLLQLAALDVKM